MQIVVNHLTRMQKGFMCVAGIDLDTRRHLRPMLDRQMSVEMLAVHGGPFDIGRIVDLGETTFAGKVPEIEDRLFQKEVARHVGELSPRKFGELLESISEEKLGAIFGPDLEPVGATCAVPETYGLRSLGGYAAIGGQLFIVRGHGRQSVRFRWRAGQYTFLAPVIDIRLYASDHVTPCESAAARVAAQIARRSRILVSVGLSRPFRKTASEPARHWLQINNIHLPGTA